jgi:hypothetical protein
MAAAENRVKTLLGTDIVRHWWQILWPNGKEHLAAREHPYISIYKLLLHNLAWSSESGLDWQTMSRFNFSLQL